MTEAVPARKPRSLLSRAPRTEPVLEVRGGRRTDGGDGVACATARPTQRPARTRAPLPEPKGVDLVGVDGIAAARRFAEHAVRLVLEVLDRRRPPEHLRAVAEPALIDMVRVVSLAARRAAVSARPGCAGYTCNRRRRGSSRCMATTNAVPVCWPSPPASSPARSPHTPGGSRPCTSRSTCRCPRGMHPVDKAGPAAAGAHSSGGRYLRRLDFGDLRCGLACARAASRRSRRVLDAPAAAAAPAASAVGARWRGHPRRGRCR